MWQIEWSHSHVVKWFWMVLQQEMNNLSGLIKPDSRKKSYEQSHTLYRG